MTHDNLKTRLLACPLCNGMAEAHCDSDRQWHVYCIECDCQTGRTYRTEAEAIEHWNTRQAPAVPDNVKGLVENGRFTIVHKLRSAVRHPTISRNVTVAAALIEEAAQALIALQQERDQLRTVVSWANNSLHGSKNPFLSLNGGPADEHHLDRPIEALKERSNQQWRRAEALQARNAALSRNLANRDTFIVQRGLWSDFVDALTKDTPDHGGER